MTTLLVGFDSAWTPTNSGAVVGVLRLEDGTLVEFGPPRIANYVEAEGAIAAWQAQHSPAATIVLLDQPTIVPNAVGQRPVENIVASPVSLRYGGMQPANTSRVEMFGADAPVWPFLSRFGGAADPLGAAGASSVYETYPVLAMIALRWMLPDQRPAGRLPKYNPQRRKTYRAADWIHVCDLASRSFRERGLVVIAEWIEGAGAKPSPRKSDQDCLDACLCLIVALYLAERRECLMVGNRHSGYIVVPYGAELHAELEARCRQTGRTPSEWVRGFAL